MNNQFLPYSNTQNLESIRAISQEIIATVEPDEQASLEDMLDGMVEDYEEGYITEADTNAQTEGGFGQYDLVTLVVVPLVINVLTKFFEKLIERGLERPKKPEDTGKLIPLTEHPTYRTALFEIIEVEYTVVENMVKSKKSRSKSKITKEIVYKVVTRRLGLRE